MGAMQPTPPSKRSTGRLLAAINLILALIGIGIFLYGPVSISHLTTATNLGHPTLFYSELGILILIIILSAVAIWKK